jgi:hypothetical protein
MRAQSTGRWAYYFRSLFTLLRGVRNWYLLPWLPLGRGRRILHLRNGLSFRIRSLMDAWIIKETCLDRDYEVHGTAAAGLDGRRYRRRAGRFHLLCRAARRRADHRLRTVRRLIRPAAGKFAAQPGARGTAVPGRRRRPLRHAHAHRRRRRRAALHCRHGRRRTANSRPRPLPRRSLRPRRRSPFATF